MAQTALVVFSGGQDSTTCLFWAMDKFAEIKAVSFDYGQRHRIELELAEKLCAEYSIPHNIIPVSSLANLGGNALTAPDIEVTDTVPEGELPNTFVPGRNIIFLSLAAARAYQLGIRDLVTGVGEADYSGYPDCRDPFIAALEQTISLGMDYPVTIHRPLMHLDKAGIWELSDRLGHLEDIVQKTHTCYRGERGIKHPWGYGCGTCPACVLRAKGYNTYLENKNAVSPE